MQKLESSLKNMVLVLVGVALIVGAVLAYINHLTSGPIAEKAEQSLAAGIKNVMGTDQLQVAEPQEVKQEFGGKEFTFVLHNCSDKSGKQRELCRNDRRRIIQTKVELPAVFRLQTGISQFVSLGSLVHTIRC